MRLALIVLAALLITCSPDVGESVGEVDGYEMTYGGNVYGVDVWCNDECPPNDELAWRMQSVYWMFEPHLPPDLRGSSSKFYRKAQINIRFSKYVWMWGETQIYGSFLNDTTVWIYYPYDCECAKGLCGGIIDYELGHVFMRAIAPRNTERQNLEYRREHNLLYSEDSRRCRRDRRREDERGFTH